ncbi:CLOCK-interacting pacemaker [Dissostichus eleginoides]|uniref:CLOCK-interacting pacemaker n=1 Tax=Dissostichus eleginoides TaxID=100907 RepID=A0AAD9FAK1_DISEL|nr:CLOCK-interacting pacemaker [Dissostichus eleginoides]
MSSFSRPDRHRTTSTTTRSTHLGASKSDLERDSGFSDASSEYLSTVDLTDSKDASRNGTIVNHDATGPQVAVMGGSYAGLSPLIIMNNFVLQQSSRLAPAENQWGFPSPLEVMPQSQVVLLQPMVSNGSSSINSSSKTGSENIQKPKSYMPILKSYPRIAHQPVATHTKRIGSSKVRVSSTSGYEKRQRRHHHGHKLHSSPIPEPAPHTTIKPISNFESVNDQSQPAEGQESLSLLTGADSLLPYTDEFRTDTDSNRIDVDQEDALSLDCNKLKRFSNTYNILNKSGLLGITLRTKQLMKENKRTQGQLQQLQEQTALLLETLGSRDPQLWTKLLLSVQHTDKEQSGDKAQRVLA